MLIELTTHTAVPGQRVALARAMEARLYPLLSAAGAQRLLWATGASGRLNECHVAWVYRDAAHHGAVADRLAADPPAWADARRALGGLMQGEVAQTLRTTRFTDVDPPPAGTGLIDLRCYRFHPEALQTFLPVCERAGLPRQRLHCGHLVFHAVSQSGPLHQLVQAWAYADHAAWAAGQQALFADRAWAEDYRAPVLPLVQEQTHQLLEPIPS